MDPQTGYYQRNSIANYANNQTTRQQGYRGSDVGGRPSCNVGNGGGGYGSNSVRAPPAQPRTVYGGYRPSNNGSGDQGIFLRPPPTFNSPRSQAIQGFPATVKQPRRSIGLRHWQQSSQLRQGAGVRSQNCNCGGCQSATIAQKQQQLAKQHPLAPATYCTPQAIKVNVTADQLQNAKDTPIYPDRGEVSQADNSNVKYIQLNWQDLLGGMENLRVSMAPPSSDSCNPNRQLKVSFGGQRTDPPEAGDTPLKVLSIQPAATTERLDLRDGNALAGTMKVCGSPANLRMAPAAKADAAKQGPALSGNYGQSRGCGNCGCSCRK